MINSHQYRGGRTIGGEIHSFIISIWNKEELPEEWKESITVPIYRNGDKQTAVITGAYHFCQLHTKCYPPSCCQGLLHMQRKLTEIVNVDCDATGQLLIIYRVFHDMGTLLQDVIS